MGRCAVGFEVDTIIGGLPAHWERTTLGSIVERGGGLVQTGPFGSQLHAADYVAVGIPSIMPVNIVDFRASDTGIERVSQKDAQRLSRHLVVPGDIVFSRRGDVERHALIRESERGWMCGTGCVLVRVASESKRSHSTVTPEFASYWLRHPDVRGWIVAHAVGTTMPNLNTTIMSNVPFALPPLPEQRAIARVLGGLDDKIELNRRMNRTLEDLARGLFRSWFVDFDPVIKGASATAPAAPNPRVASPGGGLPIARPLWPKRLIDSPLGPIPEGWRVVPLREAFEVNPTRRIPTGAIAAYLDMQNMPTTSAVPDEWVLRACGSGMKFQNGDTLMARITPCLENGKTAYVNFLKDSEVGWGSTEYIVLRSRPHLPPEYSYFLARDEDFRSFAIANMTGSSGRQRVPAAAFDKYLVVVPDPKVAAAFGGFARDVLDRVRMNSEESRKLAALRDALLPTLLSGEVRLRASVDEGRVVREAERAIDESLQATGQPLRAAQRAAARVKGSE